LKETFFSGTWRSTIST